MGENAMDQIENYQHHVAAHCETGSLKNLLKFAGLELSEPLIFGIGSGPTFYYLFFAKGPSTFPLVGIRNAPSNIVNNIQKRLGIEIFQKQYKTTEQALQQANILIDIGRPVAVSVDMYYMKYLPGFLQVHAPFHFIVLVGRNSETYAVSDPYSAQIGTLGIEDLKVAWSTGASLAKDNYLAYVKHIPRAIPWEKAIRESIEETCKNMLIPLPFNKLFFFVGIEGMKAYARSLTAWGKKYRGVALREGILFNAVGFEDQGTGGGAFRIMYGAFLQEASEILKSNEIKDLGAQMASHGQSWRKFSRKIVEIGKKVPLKEDDYQDWYNENHLWLDEKLKEASELFLEKAAFEEVFFKDLRKAIKATS